MLTRCLALLALAPVVGAQTGPGIQQPPFKSELLDNMVGFWSLTGTIGNRPIQEVADGEWVLNHQFLRLHRKEVRGPLETVLHLGFDTYNRRLVAIRLDNISALGAETPGFGLQDPQNPNKIQFTYNYPTVPFRETWTWDPQSKTWQFLIESFNRGPKTWNTVSTLTMRHGGAGRIGDNPGRFDDGQGRGGRRGLPPPSQPAPPPAAPQQ